MDSKQPLLTDDLNDTAIRDVVSRVETALTHELTDTGVLRITRASALHADRVVAHMESVVRPIGEVTGVGTGTRAISIPAYVGHGLPLRPVRAGETAAGWAVFSAASESEARAFMAANPQAAMPCWNRADFFSAQAGRS